MDLPLEHQHQQEEEDDAGSCSGASASGDELPEGGTAAAAEGDTEPARKRSKASRELPPEAIAVFRSWMLSEKNFAHPYPSLQEQTHLLELTGLNKRQLKNWFTNARRRIWKPLLQARQKGGAEGEGSAAAGGAEAEAAQPGAGPAPEPLPPSAAGPAQTAASQTAAAGPPNGVRPSASSDQLSAFSGRLDGYTGAVVRSAESALCCGEGSIVMSLTEFENPTKVHTFEVPAELYLEQEEEQTNSNRNVITEAVAVAANARCLMCTEDNVDLQAVPCQHLLHTRCLRKWMQPQPSSGPGDITATCPICSIEIARVVLAVPCVSIQQSVARPRASTDMSVHEPRADLAALPGLPPEKAHRVLNV